MSRIVVMTGGGIKGAVAAASCAAEDELILLHVDHDQPSAQAERKAIRDLSEVFPSSRVVALTVPQRPEPHEKPPAAVGSRLARTRAEEGSEGSPVAAARGLMPVLMSVGVQWALRMGALTVVTGLSRLCGAAHLGMVGDGGPADGRREFMHSFNLMIESLPTQGSKVRVDAPLMDVSLSQMVKLAQRFGVPLEKTWTCERSGSRPCGRCDPCKERARAFADARMADPLSGTVQESAASFRSDHARSASSAL